MQGAEAIVTITDKVIKERVPKSYRHPALDASLRKARSRKEYKMLKKAASLIPVPEVAFGDDEMIIMQKIEGPQVKEVLSVELAEVIGEQLGILHKNNIIHGDLTTSNMIYTTTSLKGERKRDNCDSTKGVAPVGEMSNSNNSADSERGSGRVYFIDFGLSVTSLKDEDKAVDIHLFKQALESKHHAIANEAYDAFVKGYKKTNPSDTIFSRLKKVEARGRHKNKH